MRRVEKIRRASCKPNYLYNFAHRILMYNGLLYND